MVARMSDKSQPTHPAEKRSRFGSAIRAELALLIGLGTAVIFFAAGDQLVEIVAHPVALAVVFVWLFAIILWSAISAVRHADALAVKWGEPYGTLVLTLSAITIEVVMVSTAMLHGENNPTLGRDAVFAVIMIALNGFVGLCLLLGGLRYREQHYNLLGVNSYLNVIMTLAVLGLVLPNFTTRPEAQHSPPSSRSFSRRCRYCFTRFFCSSRRRAIAAISWTQIMRDEAFPSSFTAGAVNGFSFGDAAALPEHSNFLCEEIRYPTGQQHREICLPQEFGGAMIAALVLSPEGIGAIEAGLENELQRSINILFGSVLATIGLTIPAVVAISLITKRSIVLGVQGGNLPLLLLTLAACVVTFTSRKTNVLQGCIHLLLFAVFVLLIFAP